MTTYTGAGVIDIHSSYWIVIAAIVLGICLFHGARRLRRTGQGVVIRNIPQPSALSESTDSEESPAFTLTMPAVRTCHKCQNPNAWGKQVCTHCGEPLIDKVDCLSCGRKCPPGNPTCIYCGGKLEG